MGGFASGRFMLSNGNLFIVDGGAVWVESLLFIFFDGLL